MLTRRIAFFSVTSLVAVIAFGQEPECATNYHSDGKTSETSVLTGLAPKDAIQRLPKLLSGAGAVIHWTEPAKGILKADDLDVKAEVSGNATKVTFRSSAAADKATLCRYASLVGNPPAPPKAPVEQNPALIERMKDDLIRKHLIVQPDIGKGLNNATMETEADFLAFTVKDITPLGPDKRRYDISILLPRRLCHLAVEDVEWAYAGMSGMDTGPLPTKPVRVEAAVVYTRTGPDWKMDDAIITHMESVKK